MLPVVVGTHPERPNWLQDCLTSIRKTTKRPVLVHEAGGYEIAALRTGFARFDRFLFLQDSVTILSPEFWTIVDARKGPAWLTGWPPMFLGIWDRTALPIINALPAVQSKEDSIVLEASIPLELGWSTIWPEITDHTALRSEHRHGRHNMIVGNRYFEKAKATWR